MEAPRLPRPGGSACSCRRLAANQRQRMHPLGSRPQFSVPSPLGRVSGLPPLAEGRRRNTAAAAVWAASLPCRFSAHFRWVGNRRCLESDQQRQHSGDRRRRSQQEYNQRSNRDNRRLPAVGHCRFLVQVHITSLSSFVERVFQIINNSSLENVKNLFEFPSLAFQYSICKRYWIFLWRLPIDLCLW